MIEKIENNGLLLSVIIRREFKKEGIDFFTPNTFSQQLGYMNRPAGYVIAPHVHNEVPRVVDYTQEVLFIKSGLVRVDFYNQDKSYFSSTVLYPGDVILLAHGGHGFCFLEAGEIIEVKQGPYLSEQDKVRFDPVSDTEIQLMEKK